MQRIYLTSIVLLAAAHALWAQPVLMRAGEFALGQQAQYRAAGSGIQPGPGGAGTNWNFTGLAADGPALTITIESPEGTPYNERYPGADLVEHFSNGIYQYQRISEHTDMIGFVDEAAGLRIGYPNPWRVAKRPLAYNEQFVDTLTRVYQAEGLDLNGTGFSTLHVDGYGSLALPGGTYPNVMRVTIDQINYDTSALGLLIVHFRSWRWYEPNGVFPVFRIDSEVVSSSFYNYAGSSAIYIPPATNGVLAAAYSLEGFSVRRDGGMVRVSGAFDPSAEYLLEAYDLRGARCGGWRVQGSAGEVDVELVENGGLYLLRLSEIRAGERRGRSCILHIR